MNLKRAAAAAAVAMIALGGLTACNLDSSCTRSAIEVPQNGGGGGHGGGESGTGADGSDEGSATGTGSRSGSSVPIFPFFGSHNGAQCTSPTGKP